MTPPLVSVVVPLYDKAGYVAAAIRSVLDQTVGDLELLVVDDGSTDDGAQVVEGLLDDRRLRLLRQANAGAAAARNRGIDAAAGRWVAFLDADDTWQPDKLARQLAVLEREPELVWVAGAFRQTKDGRTVAEIDVPEEGWFERPEVVEDGLRLVAITWCLWTGTIMIRRDVLATVGPFDPTLPTGDDVLLWARMAARHPRLGFVRTPVAQYRCEVAGSLTTIQTRPGFVSIPYLAQQLVALGDGLGATRAELLRQAAEQQLVTQAKRELLAGHWETARATLGEAMVLTPSPRVRWLARLAALPARPTVDLCRLALRLRHGLRPTA